MSLEERVIACGAGFAGDRTEPAVAFAASGLVHAIGLECLAERTLVPGLRARQDNAESGFDPRLVRRFEPLLKPAKDNQCRVISNLGAANPAAAGRQTIQLARDQGLTGLRVAAVVGDDVAHRADKIAWDVPIEGSLLGAHAYLGVDSLEAAVTENADVIVTGRVADSALFSAEALPMLDNREDALAGATAVGHLLECSGQITGGNFEMPDGASLTADDFASLGFPMAHVFPDGSAEICLLDGAPGRIDALTCTLQLLYEVHDPGAYITPDGILDFTGITFEEIAANRVRVSGARFCGRPEQLKVSGFVDQPGVIADIEIGYAGTHCLQRAQIAVDALDMRLSDVPKDNIRIDLVGINSMLGAASLQPSNRVPEIRVHVSARCGDAQMAQIIEDEVYALTLSGPAGGGSVRSERRANLAVVDGYIDRELVAPEVIWEIA